MKRILVADDDANLREILSAILSERGRVVDAAGDGLEALALLNQHHYDVVLSDLRMPGLDGPALYEAVRAMRHGTLPRVIFMTGNAGGGEYSGFLRETTEPMVEKPFDLDVVRHLVSVLLRER